jgi:prepilin-type N-terminal cleavage/methylation domain-containing protein
LWHKKCGISLEQDAKNVQQVEPWNMLTGTGQKKTRLTAFSYAFTLVEVLMCIVILALVMAGVCYGYAQANRIAVFCSMSQAADAFALRGMEAARAAKFNPWDGFTNTTADPGGSQVELPPSNSGAVLSITNLLDIPIKGNPLTDFTYYATNYVYVTWYPNTNVESPVPMEQIRSVCVWTFPLTMKHYTDTVVTLRAPDQ